MSPCQLASLSCQAFGAVSTDLQDRDAIVKGLKKSIQQSSSGGVVNPQAKLMEPIVNQPVTNFQFAFKIRVRNQGQVTVA